MVKPCDGDRAAVKGCGGGLAAVKLPQVQGPLTGVVPVGCHEAGTPEGGLSILAGQLGDTSQGAWGQDHVAAGPCRCCLLLLLLLLWWLLLLLLRQKQWW
jgi:hypothetical protein